MSSELATQTLQGAGSYDMLFWKTTSNPAQFNRPEATAACLALVKGLQATLPADYLVMPSAPKDDDKALHVAIFLKTSSVAALNSAEITRKLNSLAAGLNLKHGAFARESGDLREQFSEESITNVREATVVIDKDKIAARDQIMLSRRRMDRLRALTGDALQAEIKSVLDNLNTKNEMQSAWQTIVLVGRGLLVYGGGALTLVKVGYSTYTLIAWMSSAAIAISVTGWVAIFAPIAVLGAIFIAIAIATKEAANILLVVSNVNSKAVRFTRDHIVHGERSSLTEELLPWPIGLQKSWVPAGFYFYKKNTVAFYGSLFGAAFSIDGQPGFSVGMDCPLTYLGGTNSIRVVGGNNPEQAAQLANDSGNAQDSATLGGGRKVLVKRANAGGSVNWGTCIVD
ncbi:hypothetical protein BV20DRAFT_817316 [Pilatotrama ljubarskyi]|nr:hypothetical protein BV20DRAFT_817316 [Pilatotrama ljubarskyi]